jgi:hypothetical protein
MDAAFASGVMFMTICEEENPMLSVTSQDGTNIAFDRVGSGPAVILVSGATAYRAFDPSMGQLAELLGQHFTVYHYAVARSWRQLRYAAIRQGTRN